jgi:putative transposase
VVFKNADSDDTDAGAVSATSDRFTASLRMNRADVFGPAACENRDMPRSPRIFIRGLSHHVIQRGNNRSAMFQAPDDYRFYLELLGYASRKCQVHIHGYTLMTNHVHLSVTPSAATSLPQMMKRIGEIYVRRFNRNYQRTGTLCEGRYRASLIQDDRYWLTCLRYIELNPVRAKLVTSPELYEWSSYRGHAFGHGQPHLTVHPLFLALGRTSTDRNRAWQAACGAAINDDELTTIRRAIQACRPVTGIASKPDPIER